MTNYFIAISILMAFSTAFANTLTGRCEITQENSATDFFSFSIKPSKNTLASKTYSVKIPLKNTYNDDYTILVSNTAGIHDLWNPDNIQISVNLARYFCNPPVFQDDGSLSRTKCDRPRGWEVISGTDKINSPKAGDSLTFHGETKQIAFSCDAIFN